MSEETKTAVRLLLRCMDELRKHDQCTIDAEYNGHYTTSPQLKADLRTFLTEHNMTSLTQATDVLATR